MTDDAATATIKGEADNIRLTNRCFLESKERVRFAISVENDHVSKEGLYILTQAPRSLFGDDIQASGVMCKRYKNDMIACQLPAGKIALVPGERKLFAFSIDKKPDADLSQASVRSALLKEDGTTVTRSDGASCSTLDIHIRREENGPVEIGKPVKFIVEIKNYGDSPSQPVEVLSTLPHIFETRMEGIDDPYKGLFCIHKEKKRMDDYNFWCGLYDNAGRYRTSMGGVVIQPHQTRTFGFTLHPKKATALCDERYQISMSLHESEYAPNGSPAGQVTKPSIAMAHTEPFLIGCPSVTCCSCYYYKRDCGQYSPTTCIRGECNDGIDNDNDGKTDVQDGECVDSNDFSENEAESQQNSCSLDADRQTCTNWMHENCLKSFHDYECSPNTRRLLDYSSLGQTMDYPTEWMCSEAKNIQQIHGSPQNIDAFTHYVRKCVENYCKDDSGVENITIAHEGCSVFAYDGEAAIFAEDLRLDLEKRYAATGKKCKVTVVANTEPVPVAGIRTAHLKFIIDSQNVETQYEPCVVGASCQFAGQYLCHDAQSATTKKISCCAQPKVQNAIVDDNKVMKWSCDDPLPDCQPAGNACPSNLRTMSRICMNNGATVSQSCCFNEQWSTEWKNEPLCKPATRTLQIAKEASAANCELAKKNAIGASMQFLQQQCKSAEQHVGARYAMVQGSNCLTSEKSTRNMWGTVLSCSSVATCATHCVIN